MWSDKPYALIRVRAGTTLGGSCQINFKQRMGAPSIGRVRLTATSGQLRSSTLYGAYCTVRKYCNRHTVLQWHDKSLCTFLYKKNFGYVPLTVGV